MKTIALLCRVSRLFVSGRLVIILVFSCLFSLLSCEQAEPKADEIKSEGCFSKASLENTPWAKDQMTQFQRPKSGSLRVAVYSYKDEQYLVFTNGFVSSPASYIFNCSGVNLPALKIGYNQFMDHAKVVEVLLEATY